jgi:AcrR family transcriptional regulator
MTQPSSYADRRGMRTRAGNNMSKARAGILSGAARSIERFGTRKTTMADIARAGGVAKATLYNHFRDKDEVYAALLETEVDEVLARVAETQVKVSAEVGTAAGAEPLAAALAAAAAAVSAHPVLRRLAETEPAVLATLLRPGDGPVWGRVLARADELVRGAGTEAALDSDTALRWVLSHVSWPATGDPIDAARRLAAGLTSPGRKAPSSTARDTQVLF